MFQPEPPLSGAALQTKQARIKDTDRLVAASGSLSGHKGSAPAVKSNESDANDPLRKSRSALRSSAMRLCLP